jgi:O-antigen/teichoic acid export membrane protein
METVSPTPHTSARVLFKNMLKGTSLYMIAMVSPSILSLILVPVVTRRLSTAEYGVLDLLQQVGVVVSVLLGLNFSSALGYFYFEPGAVKSRVVGTTLIGAVLMGIFAASVGWIASNWLVRVVFHSPDYIVYLRLTFVGLPLAFLLEAGLAWLRTEDRAALFTGAVLLRLVLILTGTLVLMLGFGLRIGGVLGANIAAASLIALVVAAVGFSIHKVSFDSALFRRIWRFSFPMSISALGLFVIHFADRFILARFRTFDDLGVYALAYKFGMLLSPIQTAFEAYWGSQIYHILRRPDAISVFARTFTYLVLLMSACGLGVLVAAKPALRIMTAPAYLRAAGLIPIIVLAYYLRALGDFFRIVFLGRGLPSHDAACNWIAASLGVGAYFLLIPPFGATGAAVATLITFVLAGVISITWSYRVWPFQLEMKRLAKILVITAALSATHFALPRTPAIEIAEVVLILPSFAGLLLLSRFPTAAEMEIAHGLQARARQLL